MKITLVNKGTLESIRTSNPFILEIAKAFSKKGDVVSLVTPYFSCEFSENKMNINKRFFSGSITLSSQNILETPIIYLLLTLNLILDLKENKRDIVFYLGSGDLYLTAVISNLISKVFRITCVGDWLGSDILLDNSVLDFNKHFRKYILEHNTLNLVQSQYMKKEAKKISKSANIIVSPDKGVDLKKFKPKKRKFDQKNELKILFVGRLHPVKGLEYLIEAFEEVHKKHTHTKLIIVGDGQCKNKLMEIVDSKGLNESVVFTGAVDYEKIAKYYRNSNIFTLSSLSESLSHVILEAMACGLPVVATDCGGPTELVKNGKGGYLVKPKSSKELSKKIKKLVENTELRKKMGKFNQDYAKKYDTNKIMEEKRKIFKKTINNKSIK